MALCIHSGGRVVTFEELQKIETPASMGARHKPVPHHEVVSALRWSLEDLGFRINREELGVGRNRTIDGKVIHDTALFGVMDIAPKSDPVIESPEGTPPERSTLIGFRSSNVQEFGIHAMAGNRVFVCDNLALSGDSLFFRKAHTVRLNLAQAVREGVARMAELQSSHEALIARLSDREVTDIEAKAALYHLFAAKALPVKHFATVERNFFRPDQEWTDCAPRTLWGVHNAATRAIRDEPLERQMTRSQAVTRALVPQLQGLGS